VGPGVNAPAREHRLDPSAVHLGWDRSHPPAVRARSGDVVRLTTQEVTGGQVRYGDPPEVLLELDRTRSYPLAGPMSVEDAAPGDLLEVEMLELTPGRWGWSGIIPGRGLLAEDFSEPHIRYFELDGHAEIDFASNIRIPIRPFCGTIGVAPDVPGPVPVAPPQQGGGNIDTRRLTRGAKLYLPVQVPGALLSVGDCHAAQGDGEVCVTGLECDMEVALRVSVAKGGRLPAFTYRHLTPVEPGGADGPWFGSSASAPDLLQGARAAVRGLIDWLVANHGLGRADAYILCSLAADLHLSQVVNPVNHCVSAYLPLSLFAKEGAG
jgi:acetamidase/formamidase